MIGWAIILLFTVALTGWLFHLIYVAFTRDRIETLAEFAEAPIYSTCAVLAIFGVVTFFWAIASMGRLTFRIPTPWGDIESQWVSGLLALLGVFAFFSPRTRKRSRRNNM